MPVLPEPLAAPITRTGGARIDAALLAMARFVEDQRGLPFRSPVTVQFLDDAAFEAVIAQGTDDDAEVAALEAQGVLLVALGLLPDGTDFVSLVRAGQREGIVGLYSPDTDELWVRGTEPTPLVRITVVHELVHALDDQWFGASSPDPADADQAFALMALAEGSSTYVEDLYVDAMPPADLIAADDEAREYALRSDWPDWPASATELSESVYSLGNDFVSRIVKDGGMAALDAVYRDPPRSTEHLLHPERYTSGDRPMPVADPRVDGTVIDSGVMGEWSLVELLNAELSPSDARAAAEGWAGDRYVLADDGGTSCVTLDVRADTVHDADELERALSRWALRAADATSARVDDDTVRLVACRPA